MSQQQKLERVLDLLISEDSTQAAEILHQIIVEKARVIYESIVEEEDVDADEKDELDEADEVGGEPNADFTAEISSDEEEVSSDEENDGEAAADEDGDEDDSDDSDEDSEFDGDDSGSDDAVEDRVDDLESQLAELRAEFDALMGEEMEEPEHADMADEFGMDDDMGSDMDAGGDVEAVPGIGGEEKVVGEVVATMYEKKGTQKLKVAPQSKKQGNKVAEETKFLNKTADTGQKGTAKLVGTGKGTPLGAEQNQSPYTHAPSKKDYGGGPVKIGGNGGTGGEYGKYNGDSAASKTPTDNVNVKPKNSSVKADTTAKYTGGKVAGEGFTKSPLTKKPS